MAFKLPELKYSYDALEPYIDRETMILHHQKHHKTYLDNLNRAISGYDIGNRTIEDIIREINIDIPADIYWDVRNHGGGYYNHLLYFDMLSPKKSELKGLLKDKIVSNFGSLDTFKERFKMAGLSRFGSGFAWLLIDEGNKLFIKTTSNQDCPLSDNKQIVLCLDVWEHAYYLKYNNRRAEYIEAWWNVVDWDYVEGRYEDLIKK